jgi:Lysosomal transcription factor, NCU-G1
MGYGLPPNEQLSALVISILTVGLGIPVVLLVGSGIFLCCKKCCRSRDEPLLE